ncbi:MAG TPA: EAL domain-containing protein [Sulfuricurvum sp.]|nr:EAL domain-containing protein [Sulfuricurvum sp.]
MRIHRFILLITLLFTLSIYALFSYYFFKQEETMASVILKTLHSSLSETSYTLSKSIKSKEDVVVSRPLLDRIAANQPFISAILVLEGKKAIVNTDPHYGIESVCTKTDAFETAYQTLTEKRSIEQEIRFYAQGNLETLTLVYILDHDEIQTHFIENKQEFLTYFGLLPIVLLLVMFMLLRRYISTPLERLRQFAYYQSVIPQTCTIRELESVRYSMVQTFARLESEKNELYLIARTDALSGLANRNSLEEYLQKLIAASAREKKQFAFLFLDIDHFKSINDSLGHNVGDELLKNVASVIQKVVRPNDIVARIGGDEFVIVLQDYDTYLELSTIIDRIQKQLMSPWLIQTHSIHITSSVGVALYPDDGTDIVTLMKHSDIAMYQAKKQGRAQYQFFTQELNDSIQHLIQLDKEMRRALESREYELYYQPKIDLQSGEITGAEALIRWISPEKGIIAPDTFIPLAEENGFIVKLGDWIIDEALNQHLRWKEMGIELILSINISTKQLLEIGFVNKLIEKIESKKVDPTKIDIEITEYMFIEANKESHSILSAISDYGISISLDDFGTGYSSLSYLKKFPINYLKIDKTFLDDFNTEDGAVFIETIVKMGQVLKIKVVAEGVEEEAQVDFLKEIGCDQYQGYYFSKPINVADFEKVYHDSRA